MTATRHLGFVLLLLYGTVVCSAQSINFSNGAPFKTGFCTEDKSYGITGYPAGGTFSGCGVYAQNGAWYFNPAMAAKEAQVFPHPCSVSYIRNNATIASRLVFIQKPVVIHPPLQDTFTCDGTFTLLAQTLYAGDYGYVWIPAADLATPNQHSTTGTLTADQVFKVTAIDSVSGCMGSDSMRVTNKMVTAAISAAKDRICPYDSLRLEAAYPLRKETYTWYATGDPAKLGTGAQLHYRWNRPGDYTLLLVATNGQCSDTAAILIQVIDLGLTLTASKTIVNQGAAVTLETHAYLPYQVTSWLPQYLFPAQQALAQTLMPDSSRTYTAIAISEEGCIDTASVAVKVNPGVLLPNAFSPNGDGINDYFKPISGGDELIIGVFQVFNRNGQMVYQVNNSLPTGNWGWDGYVKGQPADIGTYYYYVELATPTGDFRVYKGDVVLLR